MKVGDWVRLITDGPFGPLRQVVRIDDDAEQTTWVTAGASTIYGPQSYFRLVVDGPPGTP